MLPFVQPREGSLMGCMHDSALLLLLGNIWHDLP